MHLHTFAIFVELFCTLTQKSIVLSNITTSQHHSPQMSHYEFYCECQAEQEILFRIPKANKVEHLIRLQSTIPHEVFWSVHRCSSFIVEETEPCLWATPLMTNFSKNVFVTSLFPLITATCYLNVLFLAHSSLPNCEYITWEEYYQSENHVNSCWTWNKGELDLVFWNFCCFGKI